MWLFFNDSFISIVAHRDKPGVLLVRARRAGDIEAVLADVKTWVDEHADYPQRANVPTDRVTEAVAARIRAIGYENFKDSVGMRSRHDAYLAVWETMRRWGRCGAGQGR